MPRGEKAGEGEKRSAGHKNYLGDRREN